MTADLRVAALTLTDSDIASEQVYAGELGDALADRGVEFVDDWRRADVVHLFEVNLFTRAALRAFRVPTLLRVVRSDTPLVVSTDDLYFVGRPDLTMRPRLYAANHHVQRWLFRTADAVVAISESVRAALSEHVPEERVHVVHHGVDARYFADEREEAGDREAEGDEASVPKDDTDGTDRTGPSRPFVLHVSQASPRKNPEAIRAVVRRIDAPFVVVGAGWSERLPDDATNLDVRGYVSEETLVDLYRAASVFYFPTLHEGFGLPLLEAMAAECAVVTTNAFAVPEVVGDAALTLDPNDVDGHVEAVESLLADEQRRRALGAAGRSRARTFTWEEAAERTEAVYRSVVSERG